MVRNHGVRTGSGSDRLKRNHSNRPAPDPVATAPGSDTLRPPVDDLTNKKKMQTEKSIERKIYERFQPPHRILLGPGPSPVDDRVLSAMSAPLLGHLDPLFLQCMDDVQALLRHVFETENRVTIPISATGSAGMEAALVNVIEPGDEVVVCINGVFGERMREIVERAGGKALVVEAKWGSAKPQKRDWSKLSFVPEPCRSSVAVGRPLK